MLTQKHEREKKEILLTHEKDKQTIHQDYQAEIDGHINGLDTYTQ